MASESTYIFLVGLLEVLLGMFFLVLSAGLYFFDVFEFKLKGKRVLIVAVMMFLGWFILIYGLIQLLGNYASIAYVSP